MVSDELMTVPTETEQLREQLLRAQRLSSVGTLASSVAHEFNNILTTLINYAKLGMRPDCSEASKQQAFEKILKGSQRAAVIISSMLGFARNGSTQREVTDLVPLLEEVLVLTDKDLSKHQIKIEKALPEPAQGAGRARPDRADSLEPHHQRPPGDAARRPPDHRRA